RAPPGQGRRRGDGDDREGAFPCRRRARGVVVLVEERARPDREPRVVEERAERDQDPVPEARLAEHLLRAERSRRAEHGEPGGRRGKERRRGPGGRSEPDAEREPRQEDDQEREHGALLLRQEREDGEQRRDRGAPPSPGAYGDRERAEREQRHEALG